MSLVFFRLDSTPTVAILFVRQLYVESPFIMGE